jgi:hemoglobin
LLHGTSPSQYLRKAFARPSQAVRTSLTEWETLHGVRDVSLFEIVGGQPFFDDLVDRFYVRVEVDPVLRHVYPEGLAPGKRALALFLGQYWGGPAQYTAEKGRPRLRMRHAPFAIGPAERSAWVAAMLDALADTDAPEVAKAAMCAYVEMAATTMINTGATMDQ